MIAADIVFYNGIVYTADKFDSVENSLAVKDGKILFVGDYRDLLKYISEDTAKVDLAGKTLMPGLIDPHVHPLWGAKSFMGLTLACQELKTDEIVRIIQDHVDENNDISSDVWLQVRDWVCVGSDSVLKNDLDSIQTDRPIVLFSSDCHFMALNSRGLEVLGINKDTPDPCDGIIMRDQSGVPLGFVADAPAMRYFDTISHLGKEQSAEILDKAQKVMNKEGITTILDARALEEAFDGFTDLLSKGRLTLRVFGAFEITPNDLPLIDEEALALNKLLDFKSRYSYDPFAQVSPVVSVTQAKFFVDGMIQARTASFLEPYEPAEDSIYCRYHPFFSQDQLNHAYNFCAENNIDILNHVVADGAMELTIFATKHMRKIFPNKGIRVINSHCEFVADWQYSMLTSLGICASLSFQWAGYTRGAIDGLRKFIGDRVYGNFETHGKFIDAGVLTAYNSDWPIDPLDQWRNLSIGLSRRIDSGSPRLATDRNLLNVEVLRAATINAAYVLHMEELIGSLEPGKYADFIVVDTDVLNADSDSFAKTKVLMTFLAGNLVYGSLYDY